MRTTITALFIFLTALTVSSQNQNIAAFSGTANPTATTLNNTITATALSRGPGLIDAGGATFSSIGWTTDKSLNVNDYIEWSVTAAPGYKINISKVLIDLNSDPSKGKDGKGPKDISIRTSNDHYSKDIYSVKNFKNSGQPLAIATQLSSTDGSVSFRLYGYKAKDGNKSDEGSLDIKGGLGTILGLEHIGIRLEGTVTYEGLVYDGKQWYPSAPEENSGTKDILIQNGVYTVTQNIKARNFTVAPGAGVVVKNTGSITVYGNLITSDNITLESSSTQYSSLIVHGTVTGTAKYQRHININTAGNDLISSPVTGQSFDQFILQNGNIRNNNGKLFLFGPFEKVGGSYVNWTNTETTILTPGTGYRAASNDNGAFTFNGNINSGTIDKEIIHSGTSFKEWNLVGNPYPSYIKLSDFLNATNNAQLETNTAGVYGYDGNASDGWKVWNLAYSELNPNALIAPGQGFLVSSKAGGGTISFTPEMRSIGTTDDFISGRASNTKIAYTEVKITNGTKSYSTDIYFNEKSTKALDAGYDAAIFGKVAPNFSIYSHLVATNSGIAMAVQSLPYDELSTGITIPLGINATAGQQITVSLGKTISLEGTEIYLEDNLHNTFTLLTNTDYTFTTKSTINSTGRFFLRFMNTTLSAPEPSEMNSLQVYTTNSKHLLIKGLLQENTHVTVYDIQGRIINNLKLLANTSTNLMDLSHVNSGVYIIKLKNNTQKITQKVIIN